MANITKAFVKSILVLLPGLKRRLPRAYSFLAPLILSIAALLGPYIVLGALLITAALTVRSVRSRKIMQEYVIKDNKGNKQRISNDELNNKLFTRKIRPKFSEKEKP